MKLGSLQLKNNLILAPLQNVTTAPFRRFCRYFHEIGLVYVPMLYIKRIEQNPKSVYQDLAKIEQERPIAVQIVGNDVLSLIKAIDMLESYEFDVLDFNAGCPSKRAIKGKYGGYLLKDIDMLKKLLCKAIKYSSRPVSLKTRIGFDKRVNINDFKILLNETGIEFATIHARTVKQRFTDSNLDLDFLKQIKDISNIPIIGNGNIIDGKSAKDFLEKTNVDALMIGRASMGNPEIFCEIYEFLSKGIINKPKKNKDLMEKYYKLYEFFIDEFLEGIEISYNKNDYKLMELKRNAIWFSKGLEHSTEIRIKLSKAKNLKQLKDILNEYFKEK
ncbi:MAG: tRNA dihydrouridine synthase [Promethearchaeia archaeon]